MIRAIIFDADDTLYSTSQAAKSAELKSMEFFARQINADPNKLYDEFLEIVEGVKLSNNPLRRHRLHSYGILANKNNLKNINKAYKIFFDHVLSKMFIMPNLNSALKSLSKKYVLAVVSQDFKDQLDKKFKKFGLKKYFKIIITCEDIKKMKPHKKYYTDALKKLKVKPGEVVCIGDSFERDLKIPKELGCKTIIFGEDKRADYSLRNYADLPALIISIEKTTKLK